MGERGRVGMVRARPEESMNFDPNDRLRLAALDTRDALRKLGALNRLEQQLRRYEKAPLIKSCDTLAPFWAPRLAPVK